MKTKLHNRPRSGQTMLFLVMVVVILALVALWNFDLHKMIYIKTLSLNASDSAAIAGARWQGITLNLLGDLNVAQAVAFDYALAHPVGEPPVPDFREALAIVALERQVYYAGPMVGYAIAQQGAKNNGAYVNATFTSRVHNHAQAVRTFAGGDPLKLEYADMLDTVAGEGIAALASDFAYHILLDQNFYTAIESQNWCWLQRLLRSYGGWQTWPPLNFQEPLSVNVTTYSTLAALNNWMGDPGTPAKALQQMGNVAGRVLSPEMLNNPPTVPATWFCYDNSWSNWTVYLQNMNYGTPYPWIYPIKSEYDVVGAAVDMRVSTETPAAYFNNSSNHVTSVSAAKPFGYLDKWPASQYGIVLPAFHDARLVPVDSTGMDPPPDDSTAGDQLNTHIIDHLPLYLKYGPDGIQEFAAYCQYCRDLIVWENSSFRNSGLTWLSTNNCPHTTGGMNGGGSAHGH